MAPPKPRQVQSALISSSTSIYRRELGISREWHRRRDLICRPCSSCFFRPVSFLISSTASFSVKDFKVAMLLPGSITTLIQLALASLALSQQINKPAAWPNLDQFGPALNTLPRTTYTISPWVNGYISQGCRDRVVLDGRDPTSFKSFTVSMGDVSIPDLPLKHVCSCMRL